VTQKTFECRVGSILKLDRAIRQGTERRRRFGILAEHGGAALTGGLALLNREGKVDDQH
jgi:hypothetical protein